MTNLKENDLAYNFALNSCGSGVVSLDNKDNKYTVLYFYPKDDTSGCTLEAQGFSKLKQEFTNLAVAVFGISKDDIKSHNKFIDKYGLEIDLLHDEGEIAEKYGVWAEKSMYGKKYMGIARTTFLIDNELKIIKVWKNVKPEIHPEEVLNFVKSLKE